MTKFIRLTKGLALTLMPLAAPAVAQSQCVAPVALPKARAVFPPPGSAVTGPITGYQLVLSWAPQFCKVNGKEKDHAARCSGQSFGFTMIDLRADGEGRSNPVYCKRMGPVPEAVVRETWCAMPSVPAMSHAWAKHGACLANDPAVYFTAAKTSFERFVEPDMAALAQAPSTVARFKAALVTANPGSDPSNFAVALTPLGWLEEVRLCLSKNYQPRPCATDAGAGDDAKMRIWPRR